MRSWWQLSAAAADHVKVEAHHWIDQLARRDLPITAGRHSE
jgi:hypothetical protein